MTRVTDKLSVRPQVTAGDIRMAKANGFAAIINNRPDDEEPGQPSAADNRAVAAAEVLGYTHIPVVPGQISETQIRAFQDALTKTEAQCWPIARPASVPPPSTSLARFSTGGCGRMMLRRWERDLVSI